MRFLTRTLALSLAPALAYSLSVPALPVPVPPLEVRPSGQPDRAQQQNHAAFNVPCQADDEAFDFSFEVQAASGQAPCGRSQVLLNGQPLDQDWDNTPWLQSGEGRSNITVTSSLSRLNHTLELAARRVCLDSALTGYSNSPLPAQKGDAIQVTVVSIERIDGRPSLSQAGFTVSFDHSTQQIIGFWNVSDRLSSQQEAKPVSDDEEEKDDADSILTISDDSSEISDDSSIASLSQASTVTEESGKLRYLQNELDALTVTVRNQQTLVDGLNPPAEGQPVIEIKHCRNVKCLAKSLLQKARQHISIAIVHLTPAPKPPPTPPIDPDCYWTQSRQARMSAAMHGERLCAPTPVVGGLKPSPTKTTTSSRPSTSSSYHYTTTESTDTYHKLLLPITAVASFLCLSCFSVHIHRRCCNPRARAERAARREERRTRRQYACLARRHKWRTWWNARVGRNHQPCSSDYEEKRSLIRAQEQILETAMRDEIARIRADALYDGGASDEEMAMAGAQESLPPYRSRSGSGRPPSYTSEEVPEDVETIVRSPIVITGLVSGVGDGLVGGIGGAGPSSPTSDITPDSSVANLSRRGSSDTLHSMASLI